MADLLRARKRGKPVPLTPLIDIVFILLVFFMLQTRFLRPGSMALELPGQSPGAGGATTLLVELHASGALWVDRARVEPGGLGRYLDGRAGRPHEAVIATDPGVRLQRVVDVMDVLNAHGVGRVSLRRGQRFE